MPRIKFILQELDKAVAGYSIGFVVMEGYPYFLFASSPGPKGPAGRDKFHRTEFGKGPGNQVFGIAELTGCIKMKIHYQWGVPFAAVSSTSIKKYATGNGRAGKPEMISCLHKEFGIKLANDDETDAYWLGKLFSDVFVASARGVIEDSSKSRMESVKSIMVSNNPEGTLDLVEWWFKENPWAAKKKKPRKRRR